MFRFKGAGSVLLLLVMLCALSIAFGVMLPGWRATQSELATEKSATPTPTADIRSMLSVTFDPNATPAPTILALRTGSKGESVRQLQQRLKELGFYSGEADGQYGPGTAEAVTLFQSQHGLEADGVVGETTFAAIFSSSASQAEATPTPAPSAALLKKGDKGDVVRQMQERLKELGYYSGALDGDFGAGTQEAVRLFQRQCGLEADGVAASKTFSVLYSESAPRYSPGPPPDPEALPVLVNRTHPVSESYKPGNLVLLRKTIPSSLCKVKGSEIEGDSTAVSALVKMLEAAKADGLTGWQINAGYRSFSYQKKLFNNSVAEFKKQGMSQSKAESATRQTVADPGTSEHHTGLAFDVAVTGSSQFAGTKQQIWLHKHCWDYGFIIRYQEDKEKITGYLAECWHIRYVGLPHSQTMHDKNLCLEEYLGILD